VGTIQSYWQAHMDLLADSPPLKLNDRAWVIHTRTEERPPVRIAKGAVVENSMISDGCILEPGARVECSVISPGVAIRSGAYVRQSILLTDVDIGSNAEVMRAILDKRVKVGEKARIGSSDEDTALTVVGKNSEVPPGAVLEPGATVSIDVIASDYPAQLIKSDEIILTKRQPHEI